MTDVTHTYQFKNSGKQDLALVVNGEPPQVISLRGRTITIGRSEASDVVLTDRYVSSQHCQVAEQRGVYNVRDLGSRNGTHINGIRIEEGVIRSGARIGIGESTLLCLERPSLASYDGGLERLVGESKVMQDLKAEIARFASRDAPVLIEGESGTGKELAALALHELSRYLHKPFVSVNCGALPPELAMSELFGHEIGAFTGATRRHHGAFEQAHQGTLFLDEIGELDARVQAALLRTLETGVIKRVGSENTLQVSIRLITATNRDLLAATQLKAFRLDLYHRLAVLCLRMPPLKDRLDDLPVLAAILLERTGSHRSLSSDALELLHLHHWPGNVRELRNVLERACALVDGPRITSKELRFNGFDSAALGGDDRSLLAVISQHDGSIAAAARTLGIPRTTLRDRVLKLKQRLGA